MKLFYSLAITFLLITSCASTELTSSWRDTEYKGKIKKIFLIGVAHRPSVRKLFENEFSNSLKNYGIDAVPSYQKISSVTMLDKETVVPIVTELSADAVLITNVIDKNKKSRYETHLSRSWSKIFQIKN